MLDNKACAAVLDHSCSYLESQISPEGEHGVESLRTSEISWLGTTEVTERRFTRRIVKAQEVY